MLVPSAFASSELKRCIGKYKSGAQPSTGLGSNPALDSNPDGCPWASDFITLGFMALVQSRLYPSMTRVVLSKCRVKSYEVAGLSEVLRGFR